MAMGKHLKYPEFTIITPKLDYAIKMSTGCGVMEDLSKEFGYIAEGDDYSELRGLAERLQIAFNGFYDNHQSWQRYHFEVVYKIQY